VQADIAVLPTLNVVVPCGQDVQLLGPTFSLKLPSGQSTQVLSFLEKCWPIEHNEDVKLFSIQNSTSAT
jgi:hypothetical protein